MGLSTVRDFEKGKGVPIANNLTAMQVALETAGISFVDTGCASGIPFQAQAALIVMDRLGVGPKLSGVDNQEAAPAPAHDQTMRIRKIAVDFGE